MREYQVSIEDHVYRAAARPYFDGNSPLQLLEAFGAACHCLIGTGNDVYAVQVSSAFETFSGQKQERQLANFCAREERAIAWCDELRDRLMDLLDRNA